VPAQRTLIMLAVVAAALWTGRNLAASRVLAAALLLVLVLDPWAVLAAGFWLSFGAVGLLFYVGSGRLADQHWLAAWGRAQWAVTIGMVPALLALFQQFSLISPLANAVAIPLVSLVITPLALLGALPFTDPLLWLAHGLVDGLMALLAWLAASDWAVWQQQAPPAWAVALGGLGVGWLMLPRGFPARWLGAAAMHCRWCWCRRRAGPGSAWSGCSMSTGDSQSTCKRPAMICFTTRARHIRAMPMPVIASSCPICVLWACSGWTW
jgi:competence protein ComEC